MSIFDDIAAAKLRDADTNAEELVKLRMENAELRARNDLLNAYLAKAEARIAQAVRILGNR